MAAQDPAAPKAAPEGGERQAQGQVRQELGRQAFDKSQSAPRQARSAWCCWSRCCWSAPPPASFMSAAIRRNLHPGAAGRARHRRRVRAVRDGLRHPAPGRREQGNPLLKAVVDNAFDGILVTDQSGRVFYANATYLDLIGAADANDVRPIERVFIGDPDVSEAIYRLLKAAREGRRLQEEVRLAGAAGEGGRWLRMRVRPLGESKARRAHDGVVDRRRDARARAPGKRVPGAAARHRLSRPRAGRLLLGRCRGRHRLPQRDAGGLARPRSRPGRRRLAQAHRHRRRRGRRAAHHARCRARRSEDRGARPRPQDPRRQAGAGAAVPQGRVRRRRRGRRLAHAGAQPRQGRRQRSAARGRSALHALLPEHADGDRHRRQGRPHRAQQCALRAAFEGVLKGDERSILAVVAERDRAALEAAIRKAAEGQGDIAPVEAALAGAASAGRISSSPRSRRRSATARRRSSMRSRPPRSARWRTGSISSRRWSRSASSPAASRTTSTTCCPPS